MCQVLFRSGLAWAADTIRDLAAMTDKSGGIDEMIKIVSRGKEGKPQSYAEGVQFYINKLCDLRDIRKIKRGRKQS